jgi:hypothetical protein
VRAALPGFAPPPDAPLFGLQDPRQLRRELAAAGLKDVRVETASHGMEVPSAIDLWGMLTSAAPATGALVASLTKGQRSAVRKALDGLFRQRFGAGPAVLSMQVHVGIGTR